MSNFIILKITLTCPSEEWPFRAREAEEQVESRWAAFWMPPFVEPSPCKKAIYKVTTLLRKDFTALLSWSLPQKLPNLPFTQLFDLLKILPPSMDIIDLEQQLQTITQLFEQVEESLCGAPWLHCNPEEKGYWYSLDTGLWNDPVSGLWYDPTFTFDNPLKTPTDNLITVNKSPNIYLVNQINALLHHWNIHFRTKEIYITFSLLCWNRLKNPSRNKRPPRFLIFPPSPHLS